MTLRILEDRGMWSAAAAEGGGPKEDVHGAALRRSSHMAGKCNISKYLIGVARETVYMLVEFSSLDISIQQSDFTSV
jgi:hypothetical protein